MRVSLCSVCGKPAHASETDDADRCATCASKAGEPHVSENPEPVGCSNHMKATCPTNDKHKRFITTAHVVEEWLVDENGDWLDTKGTLETANGPDSGNAWTCAECGAEAKVTVDEVK